MFTHKIISKEFENGVLVLGVEFTDGIKVITEAVKPQDVAGLKHWIKSRLASLNSLNQLQTIVVGQSIDLSDTDIVLTPEEIKQREYETSKFELIRLKEEVELGLATQAEFDAKVQEIKVVKDPVK